MRMPGLRLLTLMVTILIVLCSTSFIFLKNKLEKMSENNITSTPGYYYLKTNYLFCTQSEQRFLADPLVYSGTDTASSLRLSEYIGEDTCLVFRFSGQMCDECINFVIKNLKEVFHDYTSPKIILLGTEINSRIKEEFYGKQVVSISKADLGIPIEEYQVPYLFIADREMKAKFVFIPDRSYPEFTDDYLHVIRTRFF